MLTVDEALAAILGQARALSPVRLPLVAALGCVLAEDAVADLDSPPFDKALVDGFAVRSSDLKGPHRWLALGETIMAGQVPSRPLARGEAASVMTGAPIPPECDAVIMHEQTQPHETGVLILEAAVKAGQNLLPRGREMRAGEVVVSSGSILGPPRLGVLASIGRTEARVVPRPSVAIVPTGDELVEPGQTPGPGQIRNSNAVLLHALAIQGGAHVQVLPTAPDQPGPLGLILQRGLEADVLIIAGGVSAGQRDLVPAALESLGAECLFHKVRVKPGKPLWFGIGPPRGDRPRTLVFGLPGNPVSVLVGFSLFVDPALAALAGKPEPRAAGIRVRLANGYTHRGDRTTFSPARIVYLAAEPAGLQSIELLSSHGSADLRSTADADGFAIFAGGERDYAPGETVDFLPIFQSARS